MPDLFLVHQKTEHDRADYSDAAVPTLTVSPMPIKCFMQYERLATLGVRVPKWTRVSPGVLLDPAE